MDRERWRGDVQRWGYRRAVYMRVMGAAQRFLGLEVYRVGVAPRRNEPRPAPDGVQLGRRSLDEMLEAAKDPAMELDPALVELAFERGDHASGPVVDGTLVAYQFRSLTGSAPHNARVWVEHPPEYLFVYKNFVHPAWRGQRLRTGPAERSPDEPTHSISCVATHNYPSLRRSERNGRWHTVAVAGFLDRFGVFIAFRSRGAKDLGFRFVRAKEGAPAFDLDRRANRAARSR